MNTSEQEKRDPETHNPQPEAASGMDEGAGKEAPQQAKGSQNDSSEDFEQPEQQSELEVLKKRIEDLEDENSDLKDQYLRKQADFENYRKRMQREKQESAQYANSQLLLDLITIIDDFERAIKSAEDSQDYDAFHTGIVMIEQQFVGMLENKWGLKRLETERKAFNPEKHEAIMMVESDEYTEPTVVEDYQRGYMLYDRVLRPAKVKVANPASAADNDAEAEKKTEETPDSQKTQQENK
ncbi:MAG: nucleotide exchange factor GrpE [Spirochaetales bacterium]|nr:nucleotide exchange factor GrpE [Spirochaetales bacterium]MCF7938641.1 nucleotide exchange factor GrpE [Spirochaetales bacterium]